MHFGPFVHTDLFENWFQNSLLCIVEVDFIAAYWPGMLVWAFLHSQIFGKMKAVLNELFF